MFTLLQIFKRQTRYVYLEVKVTLTPSVIAKDFAFVIPLSGER